MSRPFIRFGIILLLITISALGTAVAVYGERGHEFGFRIGWGVADGATKLETCTEACEPGIAGSERGQLSLPVAVAVNEASGDFYVLDQALGRVERFGATGEYHGEFDGSGVFEVGEEERKGAEPSTGKLVEPRAIAVDNACVRQRLSEPTCKERDPSDGDVYVADGFSHKVIDKFTPEGEFLGQVVVPLAEGGASMIVWGLAVDAEGHLWVSEDQGLSHMGFDEFDNAESNAHLKFVADEGIRFHPGLAVGKEGDLFSDTVFESPFEEVVQKFTPAGQLLGVVKRELTSGVGVDQLSGDVFLDNVGSVSRATAELPSMSLEEFGGGNLIEGRGVGVNSAIVAGEPLREGPIYVADAGAADVAVFPLEGPKPPTIESTSVSDVTSESASLRAVVNPRGARTEYQFEYGECSSPASCASSSFDVKLPPVIGEASVGGVADFDGHEVSVHPQNLLSGIVYHFRVSARNEKNSAEEFETGEEVAFTTQSSVSFGSLLDGRKWEMISPPQKHGTHLQAIQGQDVIQAALSGDAVTYIANSPTENEPKGFSNIVQVLSRRTNEGWASQDLGLSHVRATGQSIGQGYEYRFFSEDLSVGLIQPFGAFERATSVEASEQTPYLRNNLAGNVEAPCTEHCYMPLVTAANVGSGVAFGEEGSCPPRLICGPLVVGATPNGQHVVVSSQVGLLSSEEEGGLYEWSGGELSLISVLPSQKAASLASSPTLGGGGVARGAVSVDGSRVIWTGNSGKGLYFREMGVPSSREINKGITGSPEFQAASADGSRVFFTDSGELYVYEVEAGKAVRLTTPVVAKEPTQVQGKIAGISEDGSSVYFVADGRLTEEAPNVEHSCNGLGAETTRCYLYVVRNVGGVWGTPQWIAVLSGADFPDFASLPGLTARVSPNGRWLVFMSQLSITGYDNRDAASGAKDEEVFLYDSSNNKLSCVSCAPSGSRPAGVEYHRLQGGLVAGDRIWPGETWLAGNVPGWTPYEQGVALYQSRYLSDSGRVFFDSSDALVPGDVNGAEDVYEFEPVGVGSCGGGGVSFVEVSGGCVGLVSSGRSGGESAFLDASGSGSDVFFLTSAKLVSSDFDSALDVYDARECTASAPCLPEPGAKLSPCVTESSCKVAPSPQPGVFGAPSSSTFSGLGNVAPVVPVVSGPSRAQLLRRALVVCRRSHRHSGRGRRVCERRVRARYARLVGWGGGR